MEIEKTVYIGLSLDRFSKKEKWGRGYIEFATYNKEEANQIFEEEKELYADLRLYESKIKINTRYVIKAMLGNALDAYAFRTSSEDKLIAQKGNVNL